MPELPEVETIRQELSPWVVGQSLLRIIILDARIVADGPAEQICPALIGQRVESLERRGKYLIFRLSSGKSLIMHLRMTGALLLNSKESDRYTRAMFDLSGGDRLLFRDQRRFGLIWLVDDPDTLVGRLGPDPLDDGFTPDVLAEALHQRRVAVKTALLDQGVVAGVGNMYADEALFAAGIHPLRRANDLSAKEVQTLYHCIRQVLTAAIEGKGASVGTYMRPDGELGRAHFDFKVAHRRGARCLVCSDPIERVAIQNRGTYFCPGCQPPDSERST